MYCFKYVLLVGVIDIESVSVTIVDKRIKDDFEDAIVCVIDIKGVSITIVDKRIKDDFEDIIVGIGVQINPIIKIYII